MASGNYVPRHSHFLSSSLNQTSTNSLIEIARWKTAFYPTHASKPYRRDPVHSSSRELSRPQRFARRLCFSRRTMGYKNYFHAE
jgi:hypothetical protein